MANTMKNAVEMARKFDAEFEDTREERKFNGQSTHWNWVQKFRKTWCAENDTDMATVEQGRAWDMGR